MTDQCEGCGAAGSTPHDSLCPAARTQGVAMTNSEARKRQESTVTDPRIQTFYDNAAAKGMTPGEYAIDLLGVAAILDVVEEARMEEAEEGQ